MKKKVFLFFVMAMLSIMGAKADVITSSYYSEPAAGTFYLYNVQQQQFLYRQLNNYPGWTSTPGSVLAEVTLAVSGDDYTVQFTDGKYLKTGDYNRQYLWTDGASAVTWSFTAIDGLTNTYQLKVTGGVPNNYYANGTNAASTSNDYCKWALISTSTYKTLATANAVPSTYYSSIPTVAGDYYIYDVLSQQFLNTSTRTLSSTPSTLSTITPSGDNFLISGATGKYLKIGVNGEQYLWSDGDENNTKWSITASGNELFIYTNNFTESNYAVAGKTMYLRGTNALPSSSLAVAQWALITADNWTAYQTAYAATVNKATIVEAKGDATSFITNPNFEDEIGTEWTGGTRQSVQTWRETSNYVYQATSNATLTQTLSNMPAGTYKVVAAVRGVSGSTITAKLNNSGNNTITNSGYTCSDMEINKNGVRMPIPVVSNVNFNTEDNALGWRWATATYELGSDGDITISFSLSGSGFMEVDDVHLYYMSDGSNNYAMEYSDGMNNNGHVVPCDLQTDNPNKIFRASSDIHTASGAIMNNFRHSNGFINNLVLYDGYEVTIPASTKAVASTLYRNIAVDAFATICCPFQITGGADGTFYQPESLIAGTLHFETVDTKVAGKAYLFKASSAVTALTGPKDAALATSPVDNGSGVTMKGIYTNIAAVPTDDYVLGYKNSAYALYKVNSTVTLAPFRAYFTIPSGDAAARIVLNFDDETTGLNDVRGKMENLRGVYYDMQGRSVIHPTKGLYIKAGKKVMVK